MQCLRETWELQNRSWQRRLESWRKSDKRIGGLWRWRWLVFQLLQELPPPNPCECLGWASQQHLPGKDHRGAEGYFTSECECQVRKLMHFGRFLKIYIVLLAIFPNCCRFKTTMRSRCFYPCVGVQIRREQQDSWGHKHQPRHAKDPSHHPQGQVGWQCFQRNHCLPDPSQQGSSI